MFRLRDNLCSSVVDKSLRCGRCSVSSGGLIPRDFEFIEIRKAGDHGFGG
jgi:hypothetical protein